MSGASPRQVVLDGIRKPAESEGESKVGNNIPLWSLPQVLPLVSLIVDCDLEV